MTFIDSTNKGVNRGPGIIGYRTEHFGIMAQGFHLTENDVLRLVTPIFGLQYRVSIDKVRTLTISLEWPIWKWHAKAAVTLMFGKKDTKILDDMRAAREQFEADLVAAAQATPDGVYVEGGNGPV